MNTSNQPALDLWKARAQRMLVEAARDGVVITIALAPDTPLAMGNYYPVVETRPVRIMAERTLRQRIREA